MDNLNTIKLLEEKELKGFLPKGFKFKTKPMPHQLCSMVAALYCDYRIILELGLGTGKTKVTIDSFGVIKKTKDSKARAFVICLNSAVENWGNEVKKHSDFSYTLLRGGNSQDKFKMMQKSKADFVIVNYESFLSMMTARTKYGKGLQFDKSKVADFKKIGFSVLMIDESHLIKNYRTKTFKVIKSIFPSFKNRILLTGTPFNRNLIDIWSQYLVIDGGLTFFSSITLFKNQYCENKGGFWGPDWQVTKEGKEVIEKKMFCNAIVYSEDEVGGLPEKVFIKKEYTLSKEQYEDYRKLFSDKTADEIKEIISNRGIAFRMICSGFIGKEGKVIYKSNSKLELLKDIIIEGIDRHKFVIFTEFRMSSNLIIEMLKKLKIKSVRLDGSIKDKSEPQDAFQNDEKTKVIVVNSKSGSASINLFAGTVCIFYENNGSVIIRKQSEKRIHRIGQERRCYFYDLVAKKTIEESVYNRLKEGVDVFDSVMSQGDLIKILNGEI